MRCPSLSNRWRIRFRYPLCILQFSQFLSFLLLERANLVKGAPETVLRFGPKSSLPEGKCRFGGIFFAVLSSHFICLAIPAVPDEKSPYTWGMNREQEIKQLQGWRRDLHQIPELGLQLPLTRQYLEEQLKDLDCEISHPIEHAVAAFFDGGKEKTIAFRSDMDALPVREQTGAEFASLHEGCMHACGHDGHMSTLLLLARRINEIYKDLDCNILLIFQPGEETPGGAKPIVDTGLFQERNVAAVFGLHLWPLLEKGAIATISGPMMASATEIDVQVKGKAVHSARHYEGIDALEIAARFLQEAYRLEQSLPASVYRLLQFGRMEAGRIRNVVADTAVLQGTMRAFDQPTIDYLKNGLDQIARLLEFETGATISFAWSPAYPPVTNDPDLFEQIQPVRENLGVDILDKPVMIAEDFACYQQEVPGIFFFLGTGTGIELHDSRFNFDEEILLRGADLFECLAHLSF